MYPKLLTLSGVCEWNDQCGLVSPCQVTCSVTRTENAVQCFYVYTIENNVNKVFYIELSLIRNTHSTFCLVTTANSAINME